MSKASGREGKGKKKAELDYALMVLSGKKEKAPGGLVALSLYWRPKKGGKDGADIRCARGEKGGGESERLNSLSSISISRGGGEKTTGGPSIAIVWKRKKAVSLRKRRVISKRGFVDPEKGVASEGKRIREDFSFSMKIEGSLSSFLLTPTRSRQEERRKEGEKKFLRLHISVCSGGRGERKKGQI